MIEEDILPRELTNNIPRRGKWTAEEERYTEKIICKDIDCVLPAIPCTLSYEAVLTSSHLLNILQVILSMALWTFLVNHNL